MVYAKTDPDAGSKGITAFLIEKGIAGFSIGQKIDKMGMRGIADRRTGVRRLPRARRKCAWALKSAGRAVLMSGLDYERAVLAGIQLGIMQACLDTVIPYVRERSQFGKPIGAFQLMQAKVADMYVALQSARAYVYAVARACDARARPRASTRRARSCWRAKTPSASPGEAVQALGGAGYTKDWPVERYLRDAKLLDIGAGTNEIRRMLIGRELIGR